jgi:hypothetical protein
MKLHFWYGSASLIGALCAGCGDNGATKLDDAVWCDVRAIPCLLVGNEPDAGNAGECEVTADSPVPASVPGGDRTCFDGASLSPEEACNALCDPASKHLSPALYPSGCSAAVDADATYHAGLDPRGFLANGCTNTPSQYYSVLSTAGTNSVKLAGDASVSYGDATVSVAIHDGLLNLSAPDTSCTPSQPTCEVQINQFELSLDDFVASDLTAKGLTIAADGTEFTAPGHAFSGPPAPVFDFWIPPFAAFDVIGSIAISEQKSWGFSWCPNKVPKRYSISTPGKSILDFRYRVSSSTASHLPSAAQQSPLRSSIARQQSRRPRP